MKPGDLATYRASNSYDHIVMMLARQPIPRGSLVIVLDRPDKHNRVCVNAVNDGRYYDVPKGSLHPLD